jgi:hypothetical protein
LFCRIVALTAISAFSARVELPQMPDATARIILRSSTPEEPSNEERSNLAASLRLAQHL